MARKNPLLKTGARLQSEGLLFVRQTGGAASVFVTETRDAGVTFAQELSAAGTKLVTTTTRSATNLGQAVQSEILGLGQYGLGALIDSVSELEERRANAEALLGVLYTAELEARVLQLVGELLTQVQAQIDKLAPQSSAKNPSKAAKKSKAGGAPLRNYDQLTARDVVDRLQRLSGPRASEVLSYEKSRKNRATVIRAAKQRVGA
jgi:hypothetical protein